MENLIIVAHPDDEAIWFSSIIEKQDTACVFVFQNKYLEDLSASTIHVTKVFEIIEEYSNFMPVIWLQTIKTTNPRIFGQIKDETRFHAKTNIASIVQLCQYSKIYTHNPWGEYGHSEHSLVYEIMRELAPDKILYPIYGIKDEEKKRFQTVQTEQVNIKFREKLFDLYKKKGIWTGSKGEPYDQLDTFIKRR